MVLACLVVVLIVALVPAADMVGRLVRAGAKVGGIAAFQKDGALPDAIDFDCVTGVRGVKEALPQFGDETFPLDSLPDLRCSKDGKVVSFSMEGAASDSFRTIKGWLEDSGWFCQESGSDRMASFSKREGTYRWLFLSCVETGRRTSVVLQGVIRRDETQ